MPSTTNEPATARWSKDTSRADLSFLAGGGEMGERIRALDWSQTPLGRPETWSPSLRMMVSFLLANRFPLLLWWGPQYIQIYNDAYRPVLGTKHPQFLGKPVHECWSEIWGVLKPLIDTPCEGGPATWMEDIELEINRHGWVEETHFTVAYSPVPDEIAPQRIGGVLATVHEITEKVIGQRRVSLLSEFGTRIAEIRTVEQLCTVATEVLHRYPKDVPFAVLYLFEADGERRLRRICEIGASVEPSCPKMVALDRAAADAPWPLAETIRTERAQFVETGITSSGNTSESPVQSGKAVILPIKSNVAHAPAGALVVGISAQIAPDSQYLAFCELLSSQVATAIANARSYEAERARAEALAEIDRAKTAFFSNVSHEFRTPLTLMLGPVEEAAANSATPAPVRAQLELAHRSGVRLLKLVNSLLDFARIEAGRIQASYEPTDLTALTRDLASTFRSAMARAGLAFTVECNDLGEPVYTDREMWEKIVLNLLSNAFKYTVEGSITVRLYRDASDAVLAVIDTGIGIPEHEMPRLFERFHRVEETAGRTQEGSGIGLALVQELVKLHGGAIRAKSTLGQGSTFEVRLPFGPAHLPTDRIRAPRSLSSTAVGAQAFVQEASRWIPTNLGETAAKLPALIEAPTAADRFVKTAGARIVLADDNADMRAYVWDLLSPAYAVEAVADGEQALAAIRRERPDLVLSDIMMPRIDGLALVKALRADEALRSIPVILLSARAGEEARLEGLDAGADDYLVKPFSARELLARIGARLELVRMRHESEKRLREEMRVQELLGKVSHALVAAQLDIERVVQIVTDAATELSGAAFGAFFYNVQDNNGEWYRRYSLSGAPREAFARFPQPRNIGLFGPTFRGEGVVRSADITADPRYGHNAPYRGMPEGHLPVRSYLAVPAKTVSGPVLGGLFFGHPEPGVFDERAERLVLAIAAQAAVAFDNARLHQAAQQEIAQRKRAEDALGEADRRKDEFLAMLAHELRNPLAPIGHASEILSRMLGEEPRAQLPLAMIKRQAAQLTRLVDDLLDVSRITQGRIPLERRPVELAAVIAQAVETVEPYLREKQHNVSIVTSYEPLFVDGDFARLVQCVANILGNAAKYTDAGGEIWIRTRAESTSAVIEITDTGAGISPELLPNVFDLFVQSDRTLDRAQGGLGIGLAVVKRLVEMHGGQVTARSAGLAAGSTFEIRLPRTARPQTPGIEDARFKAPSRRVLIVDDNQDAANSLAMLLNMQGHDAQAVYSGKEAIQRTEVFRPDVALLDIGLPEMDGYELAGRLRAMPQLSGIRLVALTGYGQAEDYPRTQAAGFDDHLVKPVDPLALEHTLAGISGAAGR